MRYFRLRPDARLSPWIKCYWWVEPDPSTPDSKRATADSPDLLIPMDIGSWCSGSPEHSHAGNSAIPQTRAVRKSYVIGGRSSPC